MQPVDVASVLRNTPLIRVGLGDEDIAAGLDLVAPSLVASTVGPSPAVEPSQAAEPSHAVEPSQAASEEIVAP